MQGYKDPFNRRCFPWGKEDADMLNFVKQLGEIRKSSSIFVDGTLKFLTIKDDVISFARVKSNDKKAIIIFINRSDKKQVVHSLPEITQKYSDFSIIRGEEIEEKSIAIAPYDYAVVKVE